MRAFLVAVGITLAVWLFLIAGLALAGRRTTAKELATLVPNLVMLFRDLLRDRRVPRSSKVVVGLALLWLLNPLDLIPEFIPVLGPLDDAIVAALALTYLLRHTPPEVITTHWRGSPATLARILRPPSRPPAPHH